MRRGAALLFAVGLAACADAGMYEAPSTSECPDNSASVSPTVSPASLARDAAVEIAVEWVLHQTLGQGAVAELAIAGEVMVEVEVGLASASGAASPTYAGSILNPFGAAVPAGVVSVLAQARPVSGCGVLATAATSLVLE
jgi:hypothetical protein